MFNKFLNGVVFGIGIGVALLGIGYGEKLVKVFLSNFDEAQSSVFRQQDDPSDIKIISSKVIPFNSIFFIENIVQNTGNRTYKDPHLISNYYINGFLVNSCDESYMGEILPNQIVSISIACIEMQVESLQFLKNEVKVTHAEFIEGN